MTDAQLAELHYAIQRILGGNIAKEEILSWTLTYLVRYDDKVTMRTVFIPEVQG